MLTALRQSLTRLRKRADEQVATAGAGERLREVWPYGEWNTMRRAFDELGKRGIQVYLRCDAPGCKNFVMTHHRGPDGALILRCRHKDRILSKVV